MNKYWLYTLFFLALLGVIDAGYLTFEHYRYTIPPCSTSIFFIDCGRVLKSQYSQVFGLPLALFGLLHYSFLTILIFLTIFLKKQVFKYLIFLLGSVGFVVSLYLMYLQFMVIKSLCLYCLFSAILSTIIFLIVFSAFKIERVFIASFILSLKYKVFLKRIFFKIDPEIVHTRITHTGEFLGSNIFCKNIINLIFNVNDQRLQQKIAGIEFNKPIGLAAGFDYEARLTQILTPLSFGFQSVGTITNMPYKGNPKPMLGRLPKSKSLMVNKGFKNYGAKVTAEKLSKLNFIIPLGVSIGRTNSFLKTQKESINDIIKAFTIFENARVKNSYYELNISCPNLFGNITFYPPKNLKELLEEIEKLKIKKPIFIKMPIEKSDEEILEMLKIIAKFSIKGVIFGNLQKDRNNKYLVKEEVSKFKVGNFSGKPTFDRSNELIKLAYKHYKNRFVIIGCGGVFTAEDAYKKIKLGASLVQLITGLIFEGPQLVSQINLGLLKFLERDGYSNISEAVGVDA